MDQQEVWACVIISRLFILVRVAVESSRWRFQLAPAVREMQDLLPPSPTVPTTAQKYFPTPSPLAVAPPMALNLSAVSSATVVSAPHSSNPDADSGIDLGPPIKPLDLSRMDTDELFFALERVVEDMKDWLGCVESGLDELLRVSGQAGVDGDPRKVDAVTT